MKITLEMTDQYGMRVRILDAALADEFDDFLGEGEYVLYNVRSAATEGEVLSATEFYFGKLADAGKVNSLVKEFISKAGLALGDYDLGRS